MKNTSELETYARNVCITEYEVIAFMKGYCEAVKDQIAELEKESPRGVAVLARKLANPLDYPRITRLDD